MWNYFYNLIWKVIKFNISKIVIIFVINEREIIKNYIQVIKDNSISILTNYGKIESVHNHAYSKNDEL